MKILSNKRYKQLLEAEQQAEIRLRKLESLHNRLATEQESSKAYKEFFSRATSYFPMKAIDFAKINDAGNAFTEAMIEIIQRERNKTIQSAPGIRKAEEMAYFDG